MKSQSSPASGAKQVQTMMRPRALPIALAISALLATACGGGGGGGGGTSNPVKPTPEEPTSVSSPAPQPAPEPAPVTPPPQEPVTPAPTPATPTAGEISASSYVGQSGAKTAWDQGYTGKGITVAIVDSGLAGELADFSGRVHSASGNFTEDSNNLVIKKQPVGDDDGHGTWVASVLGAGADGQNTVGIAPEASVLSLGFFGKADVEDDGSFWINLDRLTRAYSDSRTAGASVVNGSFTLESDNATFRTALQQSVAANQVLVFAAGNEGEANPGVVARYAKEAWANGQIIAVGAVDRNNVITSYSNRAGDAMQFFLVARGDVQAVGPDGQVVSVAGTSFAAPQVSGAAALIKQKWPLLSAAKIADVLFTSATDLGDAGTDAVYGRGLLNIDRAMQPIGQPTIALAAGGAVPVAATGLTLPAGGLGSALAKASSQGAFTVAAVDSFGRDFRTDLAPRVSQAGSLLLEDLQQGLFRDIHGVERNFGGLRLSLTPAVQAAGDRAILTAGSFFGYGEHSRWQFAGGSADRLGQFFGLESRARGQDHPYFNLARGGQFAGTGFALSDHSRFRAGALSSTLASGQVLDFSYSSRSRFQALPAAGDWSVALTAGNLAEKDRLLGMAGTGAFALAPGRSSFTTLGARYWLDARTDIGGSFTLGRTAGSGAGLLQFSPLTAWSAEARISRADAWTAGDRLSFSVGRPMVISSGTLAVTLPVRISDDGTLGFRETRLDLGGGNPETRLGFSYAAPDSKLGRFSVNGIYRHNAENQAGRREGLFGFQYQLMFN